MEYNGILPCADADDFDPEAGFAKEGDDQWEGEDEELLKVRTCVGVGCTPARGKAYLLVWLWVHCEEAVWRLSGVGLVLLSVGLRCTYVRTSLCACKYVGLCCMDVCQCVYFPASWKPHFSLNEILCNNSNTSRTITFDH